MLLLNIKCENGCLERLRVLKPTDEGWIPGEEPEGKHAMEETSELADICRCSHRCCTQSRRQRFRISRWYSQLSGIAVHTTTPRVILRRTLGVRLSFQRSKSPSPIQFTMDASQLKKHFTTHHSLDLCFPCKTGLATDRLKVETENSKEWNVGQPFFRQF